MRQDPAVEPILIVGSGAMACLFGARLAAKRPVTMLAGWPAGVEALQRSGIRMQTDEGWHQYPVSIATDPAELPSMRHGLVLVKAWQTERAARQLEACLAPQGLVLTLQNGLGNQEILAEILGEERVAVGVTTYGATLLGPGQVRPAGEGIIELGEKAGLTELQEWLAEAGFNVKVSADLASLAWGKLAVNAGINPITALSRAKNGFVAEQSDARWILERAVEEVKAVAGAKGIQLPQADPVAATLEVAARTADNRSSMLQDLTRGAPTEIDAICGAVVKHGQQVGVPTPINQHLWRLVKAAAAAAGEVEHDRH